MRGKMSYNLLVDKKKRPFLRFNFFVVPEKKPLFLAHLG